MSIRYCDCGFVVRRIPIFGPKWQEQEVFLPGDGFSEGQMQNDYASLITFCPECFAPLSKTKTRRDHAVFLKSAEAV